MKRIALFAVTLACSPLLGCATIEADAAIVAQKVSQNAAAIRAFCTTEVIPAATSPLTQAALLAADLLPYGSDLTLAANSAVATCNNIDAVAQSATTLPWLQSQLPVISGAGKVAPPAVIAPAPVTAAPGPGV